MCVSAGGLSVAPLAGAVSIDHFQGSRYIAGQDVHVGGIAVELSEVRVSCKPLVAPPLSSLSVCALKLHITALR